LQNMELYHHAEKRLLAARGIIKETFVRDPGRDLDLRDATHIDFLNTNVLALLDRLKMPRCPRLANAFRGPAERGTTQGGIQDAKIRDSASR